MNPPPTSDSAGSLPGPNPENRSTASRRNEAKKRRRVWILVAFLVIGMAALAWKFVVPGLKAVRAKRFAAEAQALMRRDEYNEAFAKVLAALRFAPNDPVVLRTAAMLCSDSGNPNGLRYYESLINMGAATVEDRKNYAQLALALRRIDLAGRELVGLLKADPKNLELLHLMAQQYQEAGNFSKATQLTGYALGLRPDDPKTQYLYGVLLSRNRTNLARASGRRTLWGLALTDGPYADRAVEALMLSSELSDGEIRLLIRDLHSRTNLRPTDVLRAYELRMRLEPGRTNELVREAFETISATNSRPQMLGLLCQWSSQQRQPELILEKVPATVARTNLILAPLRAFALAQAKRWDELKPVLEDKRFPLDPTVANVLRGEMAMASRDRKEAEAAFRAALEPPKIPLDRIILVARSAEAAGFPLVAVSAYQRLFGVPGRSIWASMEIIRVLGPVDDLTLVRDAWKKLNDQLPGDDTVMGERAWAELLLNNRVKESKAVAQRLMGTQPKDQQWRFLLALAHLRENHPAEALALIDGEAENWESLKQRCQVVYVAALGANQQREAARTYAAKIKTDPKMRSAETELVKPYLPVR